MGDLSAEPSMEEILSSIKRIIAEEGEAPGRHRRTPRASAGSGGAPSAAPSAPAQHAMSAGFATAADEVLELSDPMPATPAAAEIGRRTQAKPAPPPHQPAPEPDPVAQDTPPAAGPLWAAFEDDMSAVSPASPAPEVEAPIVSSRTADASRGSLDQLSRLVVKPEAGSDGTLEGMVRDMLRPMLRDWLDRNLPSLVETMVAREIARITAARD